MKIIRQFAIQLFIIAALVLASACQTVPEEVPEGISTQEFFQRAQEYTDELNYDAALFYLEEFKVRFPDDVSNHLAADYQIALISYKRGDMDLAERQFQQIVDTYAAAEPGTYPEWVDVLSRKLLEKIRAEE
jgi:outer membrane protein assembly factor BamD (BamD/ComL family)